MPTPYVYVVWHLSLLQQGQGTMTRGEKGTDIVEVTLPGLKKKIINVHRTYM